MCVESTVSRELARSRTRCEEQAGGRTYTVETPEGIILRFPDYWSYWMYLSICRDNESL